MWVKKDGKDSKENDELHPKKITEQMTEAWK